MGLGDDGREGKTALKGWETQNTNIEGLGGVSWKGLDAGWRSGEATKNVKSYLSLGI